MLIGRDPGRGDATPPARYMPDADFDLLLCTCVLPLFRNTQGAFAKGGDWDEETGQLIEAGKERLLWKASMEDVTIDEAGVPFAMLLPNSSLLELDDDEIPGKNREAMSPGPYVLALIRAGHPVAAIRAVAAGCTWEHDYKKITADDRVWHGVSFRKVKEATDLDESRWTRAARMIRAELAHLDDATHAAAADVVREVWKQHGYQSRTLFAYLFPTEEFGAKLARLAVRRAWKGCSLLAHSVDDPELADNLGRL